MVSYMRGFILLPYDFAQQGQQSVAFLFGQGAQLLFVPVIKQLTADPESLLALLRQLELIGASCFFLGDQPIVDQFGDTPLRIAPVHPQRLGQFGRSTARMLANIDDEEYQTAFYAQGVRPGSRISVKLLIQSGKTVGEGLKHHVLPFLS